MQIEPYCIHLSDWSVAYVSRVEIILLFIAFGGTLCPKLNDLYSWYCESHCFFHLCVWGFLNPSYRNFVKSITSSWYSKKSRVSLLSIWLVKIWKGITWSVLIGWKLCQAVIKPIKASHWFTLQCMMIKCFTDAHKIECVSMFDYMTNILPGNHTSLQNYTKNCWWKSTWVDWMKRTPQHEKWVTT